MAEEEGFEPPQPFQVGLVLAKRHDAGLCHSSVELGRPRVNSTPSLRVGAECASVTLATCRNFQLTGFEPVRSSDGQMLSKSARTDYAAFGSTSY